MNTEESERLLKDSHDDILNEIGGILKIKDFELTNREKSDIIESYEGRFDLMSKELDAGISALLGELKKLPRDEVNSIMEKISNAEKLSLNNIKDSIENQETMAEMFGFEREELMKMQEIAIDLHKQNRTNDCLAVIDFLIQLTPSIWELWEARGSILEKKQHYEKALENYTSALQATGGLTIGPYAAAARCFCILGNKQKALDLLSVPGKLSEGINSSDEEDADDDLDLMNYVLTTLKKEAEYLRHLVEKGV